MQQNGIKRDDGRGKVSRVSETGIKIEGRDNWLSFSKPEYRKEPFEIPVVGDFVLSIGMQRKVRVHGCSL